MSKVDELDGFVRAEQWIELSVLRFEDYDEKIWDTNEQADNLWQVIYRLTFDIRVAGREIKQLIRIRYGFTLYML